jgi:hypothetical protein
MSPLPDIAPQHLLLGLASAGLLLWTLLVIVRSRLGDDILAPRSLDDEPDGLFRSLSPPRPNRQLSFVGSVFLHLAAISLLPWIEEFAPGKLPFRVRPYDFVVVQFRTQDASLTLPPDIARLLPQLTPVETPPPPREAEPSDEDDPGRGNRVPAPRQETEPAGGSEQAPAPPEPPVIERVEIDFPERVAPRRQALAADAPAPSRVNTPAQPGDLSWQFTALETPKLPDPGLISDPAAADRAAELTVARGNMPEIIRGSGGQPPSSRPSLIELVGEAQGAIGAGGVGLTDAEGEAIRALLAESYGSGTLLDLVSSAGGAGLGSGPGVGDDVGAGIIGEFGGEGFGEGWRGRGPVPRKLHGIIVISDEPAIPEAAGILKGNPVYTVYLDVPGFDRRWILQVCETEQDNGGMQVQDGVIRIVTRKEMDPPFAFRRVGPRIKYDALDPYSTPSRVVVYAKVDAEGAINSVRVVSGLDPETDDRILTSVREWDFHPAYRDGKAVEVEALFGIPVR